MRKRIAWAIMWLAGAALAAVGAAVVISTLGTDLFGGSSAPLSQAQVSQQLAAQRSTATPPPVPRTPRPGHRSGKPSAPSSHGTSFRTAAGTISASCSAGLATLTRWQVTTPGYQQDGMVRGPAPAAWIRFRSGTTEQTTTVTCAGGVPHHVFSNETAGEDHGGGGKDDGGGDDGGRGGGRSPGGSGGGGGGRGGGH